MNALKVHPGCNFSRAELLFDVLVEVVKRYEPAVAAVLREERDTAGMPAVLLARTLQAQGIWFQLLAIAEQNRDMRNRRERERELGYGQLRGTFAGVFATAARERGAFSWSRYRFAEFNPQATYPAEVLRVIDGDTFEARVRIWSGFEINTRVRLRAIDAPELHARCASEYLKAEAARGALQRILSAGGVTVSQVGPDKYRGRIDAAVATRETPDVAAALLKGGFARSYDGGRRAPWC